MSDTKESRYLTAFGKRVADIRRSRHLTQEQLAERAGLTPLAIGFIEQGRRWPRITTMHKLAKGLEIPVAELFKGL